MPVWKKFNKAMRQLIDEGAGVLKGKLDAKVVAFDEVNKLRYDFLNKINDFYGKLDNQLYDGYNPANFDLTSAIKDLTVGMLETFVHIGTGGASAVAQGVAKQVAIDSVKRLAGFDAPTEDFKNPMDRTIESTTNIIGNNAIGRTIGRVVGLLEDLFNPNKKKEEFYGMRKMLEESQVEISKYLGEKLDPLAEQGKAVATERFKTDIKSNFKRQLKEKLDLFVQRLKDFPEFQKELVASLMERKQTAKFLPTLIRDSYAFVNSPSTEDDNSALGTTGLRSKWRAVMFAINDSQKLLSSPVVQQMGGVKKWANNKYTVTDMTKLLGFDTLRRWFWEYRT